MLSGSLLHIFLRLASLTLAFCLAVLLSFLSPRLLAGSLPFLSLLFAPQSVSHLFSFPPSATHSHPLLFLWSSFTRFFSFLSPRLIFLRLSCAQLSFFLFLFLLDERHQGGTALRHAPFRQGRRLGTAATTAADWRRWMLLSC